MKVGLIGFGKTGKAVANAILQNPNFSLEWVYRQSKTMESRSVPEFLGVESDDPGLIYSACSITFEELVIQHPVEYVIDFSSATAIHSYGPIASRHHIKIISAISHYSDDTRKYLRELAKETVVFWSPNITLGINYLMFAAKFFKKIAPWVDVEIIEEHFKLKEGVSGTAVKIADSLDIDKEDIISIRAGGIVGRHEILFGFPYQTVRLIHESISREAFGNGAMFVAENLVGKPRGFYKFEDILLPYFAI